jgi:hypothetical protein
MTKKNGRTLPSSVLFALRRKNEGEEKRQLPRVDIYTGTTSTS